MEGPALPARHRPSPSFKKPTAMSHLHIIAALLSTAPLFPAIGTLAADADGKIAFNHCRTRHSPRPGDNRLGPSMYGIFGAEAGKVPGFRGYSGGLSGFNWDEAMLDKFIANPTSVSTSTNMILSAGRRSSRTAEDHRTPEDATQEVRNVKFLGSLPC